MVSANGSIDLMERLKVPPRFGKRTVQQEFETNTNENEFLASGNQESKNVQMELESLSFDCLILNTCRMLRQQVNPNKCRLLMFS
ncbi:hypothetical protein RDWZM_004422 [Blomia tropicalis]|uniref:Uncharacterized protein n=1 Tax=Blomia tropicalis TaxID=40697 RepID=A0A9Q0MHT3_BLOTA|nr:hypothetical protein RDWZM_004422 [Blomia tropicalis]